jgi:hypothetical protein
MIQKPVPKAYATAKAQLAIDRSTASALSLSLATWAGAAGCLKFVPRYKINGAFRFLRERF